MVAALALLLTAGTLAPPAPAEVQPGTPIVSIVVDRHDVFDTDQPGTTAWPYRVANALHVLTKERFIRSLLLFKVGDSLEPGLLAESERLLRDTGFLNPVHVFARPAAGGCEVVVETHDQWTTEAGLNYGRFGNRSHAGFGLAEENLLGWGKELLLDVESGDERDTVKVSYRDPLFLGRRLRLLVERSNATDGSVDGIRLESPFFALATPRAAAVEWKRSHRTEYLYASGKKAVRGDVDEHIFHLWGGLRLPGEPTRRLVLGFFHDQLHFGRWLQVGGGEFEAPEDRELAGVEVGLEQQPRSWSVVSGFRGWQRQEDVPLGTSWSASLGFSLPALGGDRPRVVVRGDATTSGMRDRLYLWATASLSGRLERSSWVNGLLHVEAGGAQTGEQGWRGRVACDLGHALDRDVQITLGANVGLRGWDPDTFDGTSRAIANLEWRHRLTGEVLHLGIIGLSVFADGGRTWGARLGEPSRRWHRDVGAGLLIELTRASTVRIIRVEVAMPDDGRGAVFLATGSSLF